MKILAVGDLHRKREVVMRILRFAKKNGYKKVVFMGDYADDFFGDYEDTRYLWDLMINPPKGYKRMVVPLMGNHDFAYAFAPELRAMYGFNEVQTGFDVNTLRSIDIPFMKLLSEKLLLQAEIDGVLYTHAGVTTDWEKKWLANGAQGMSSVFKSFRLPYMYFADQSSPIWARYSDGLETTFYSVSHPKQVFGHTPSKTCTEFEDGCWCIDTFSTDRLGRPIGDQSILEIVDGRDFRVIAKGEWSK